MLNFVSAGFLLQIFGTWGLELVVVGGMLGLIIVVISLAQIGYLHKVKYRATVEPLAVWDYSAADWAFYAGDCGLSRKPKGAAKVRITPLDIWIIDERKSIRLELDETLKCVTDWQFAVHILTLRVLWVRSLPKGGHDCGQNNFSIPVPAGKESDALRVLEYFKKNKAEHADKLAKIMRYNDFPDLIWEAKCLESSS